MPSLDNAIKNIHDMILNRFGIIGHASGSVLVAFEFGTPIPVSALQSPSNPLLLSPARALELMSVLANVVPDLRSSFFERGLRTVDGQYEVLLRGSEPINGSVSDLFNAIKADALRKFDDELGSVEGLHRFHPSNANPVNWYDTAANENWMHFQTSSEDQPTESGIVLDPHLHQFRLVPVELRPIFDSSRIQSHLDQLAFSSEPTNFEARLTTTRAFATDVLQASQQQPVIVDFWASWSGPSRSLIPKIERALRSAQSAIRWIRVDIDNDPDLAKRFSIMGIPVLIAFMNGQATDRIVGSVDESEIQSFIKSIDSKFIPIGANKLFIAFDMCIVLLNRPWFSDGFLDLKSWFVSGFRKGDFSDGSTAQTLGLLNTIPIACVLVRDVSVVAQWTAGDRSMLESAVHMGPFSLHGHDFDQGTGKMTVKGMQSIAWVCAAMPLLPPDSDPSLPPN